eukprot:1158760-Pelagomonas_calceolata.AAC.10
MNPTCDVCRVVNSSLFECFYISIVLVSCVVLMLDVVSLDPSSTKAIVLRNLDAACTAVFGLEVRRLHHVMQIITWYRKAAVLQVC